MSTRKSLAGYARVKRALDVTSGILGLLVLSPVIITVSLLVWAKLGRPVIFAQDRPGRNEKLFRMYKFRTMLPVDGGRTIDEDRLTPFGRRLRELSLDELPTLWNVVRGDMSFVGPRPLLVEYLDRYTPEQARRHEVPPGVTGLAQASGRNSLSWEQKLSLDVQYVEQRSLALDARIIGKTIASVVRREGIAAEGHATSPEFMGSDGGGDSQ